MREVGTVTKVTEKFAVVSVDKKAECAGCGLCLFKDGTNKTEFFANNTLKAEVGDTVAVERSGNGKLYGVLLAFLVPLLLIGLAVVINYLFIKSEIWIPILSVALIVLWFFVLSLLDKKFKNIGAFRSEIVEIIAKRETVAPEENNGLKQKE